MVIALRAVAASDGAAIDAPVGNEAIAPKDEQTESPKEPPEVLKTEVTAERLPPPSAPSFSLPQPPPNPASPFFPEPVPGYRAGTAVTGTGIDTPLLNIPATVDVVPRAVIADQQALQTYDLLRNVPGAVVNPTSTDRLNQITMRGFLVSDFELRKDGFVDLSLMPRELSNIERVEFLQGPASILYGGGQPGGVVNFITKMPQAVPADFTQFQFGSFGLRRFVADSTGPLPDNNSVLYRNIVTVEDSGSFREFGFTQRVLVNPSLTWRIDEDTTLTVMPEYLYTRLFFDQGIVAPNGNVRALPITESFQEPDDIWHEDDFRISLFLDHRLNQNWTIHFSGQAFWFPGELQRTLPIAFTNPDTLLRIKQYAKSADEQDHSIIANLTGKIETGPITQRLLFGTELGWLMVPDFVLQESNPFVTPLSLNIYDPVYRNPAFGAPDPPLPFFYNVVENQTRYGFYGEDLIDVGQHWKMMAGVRYDIVHESFSESSNVPLDFGVTGFAPLAEPRESRFDPTYFHWSPRVGLIYQPIPKDLSLYGSYSQSFNPVFGGNGNGGVLIPETGFQWEGGIKANLLDDKLTFTAAGYHIVKDNVAVPDPTKDIFFFDQVGQERSQGVELGLVGNLTKYWSIIANYAYTDTKVTQDIDPTLIGKRFLSVPLNNGNVWTRYNIVQRPEQTMGVALGIVCVGGRPGDLPNSFELPAYERWDAGLYYKRRHLNFSLYLENLFNTQYYVGSVSAFQVLPGAPFTVRGSARWDF